ncbi:uncharacterized protein [Apostichopus japonicus]|uniref:uncharacterized protein n=1 Tax=Stichopus japonicus TaxID=307972 RepID=UPI003AB8A852
MYKAILVVILASILATSFSEEHFLEDDEEMTRSLDDWLQEDRREVVDSFLQRLYQSRQVDDIYERAQMAFKSCDELNLMTDNCSGNGQCIKLSKGWFRCKCQRKYYGPKCSRKL